MEVGLFPTYFWKLKVPNHQYIKDKYLQIFIDGYEKDIYTIPEGWVTHKCHTCLLYTSPSPRDKRQSRMPSSA